MACSLGHAFRTEYTGGFDVVFGNPPYVKLQSMGKMSGNIQFFEEATTYVCIIVTQNKKPIPLKTEIAKTDCKIDQMARTVWIDGGVNWVDGGKK